jgi:hypothetical protein
MTEIGQYWCSNRNKPQKPSHQLAVQSGLSKFSSNGSKLLKKLCPYKIRAAQLFSLDWKTKTCYCRCILELVGNAFPDLEVFLYETWFTLNGNVSCLNNRYWCSKSTHSVHTVPLHGQVQLWCAVDAQKIIRDHAFQRNNKFLPPCSVNSNTIL